MVGKPRSSRNEDSMELMFTKFNAKLLTLVLGVFSVYALTILLGWWRVLAQQDYIQDKTYNPQSN